MKTYITTLLLFFSFTTWSRPDTVATLPHATYERHSTLGTVSLGFIDYYRQYYTLPKGYEKSNTAGFAPLYLKLEYGLTGNISIAATMSYDAFVCNYRQDYTGFSGTFTRYRANNTRIFSGGVAGFYHLGKLIRVNHLDPFVGIGLSLNNIRYGAYPQGDSSLIMFDHTVTPYLKAGARYYISSHYSLFVDAGYDQQSVFSIGASCRFFGKGRKK